MFQADVCGLREQSHNCIGEALISYRLQLNTEGLRNIAGHSAGSIKALAAGAWLLVFAAPTLALEEKASAETHLEDVAAEDVAAGDVVVEDVVEVEGEAPEIPPLNGINARLPGDSVDLPMSFSSVDHRIISEQTALTLSDGLLNIPGVNVQTGSGTFDSFFIRGFDSLTGGLVLTDGAPEPESTFQHLYNVESLEVVRGASGGFLFGGRALAGTVNMVRKRPNTREQFFHLALIGGSDGYGQATIDGNWQLSDRSALRLNGLWHSADNFRQDNESDAWAVNPTFRWAGEHTVVDVSLEALSNDFTPDGGIPVIGDQIADVERDRSYDFGTDFQDQDVTRFQLNISHDLSDRWQWRSKLYFSELDWQSAGTLITNTFSLGPFGVGAVRTLSELDDVQTFAGIQTELATTVEQGGITHDLIFGIQADQLHDDFRLNVSLLAPVEIFSGSLLGDPTPIPIPSVSRFGDVSSDVLAAFVFDRITFSDRFQLTLGARWDSIEFDGDGTALDRDDNEVSPFLGVLVAATDQLSFFANYAESFEPQSTLAVGEVIPEQGDQVELGFRLLSHGGKTQTTVSWYSLNKENIAIPDSTGFQSQTGDQESTGVELEVVARLRDELDLRFSYAYTDAELTEFRELVVFGAGPTDFFIVDHSGNVPVFTPEHLANLWLTKRFGNGLGVGLGSRYLGEQFIAEDNVFATDDVLLFDAALFYNFNRIQLNLNVLNLGDEDYETRAFGKSSVSPADGLQVRAGIRFLL